VVLVLLLALLLLHMHPLLLPFLQHWVIRGPVLLAWQQVPCCMHMRPLLPLLQHQLSSCPVLLAWQHGLCVCPCMHMRHLMPVLQLLLLACPVLACLVVPWVASRMPVQALLPVLPLLLHGCPMILTWHQLLCLTSPMQDACPSTAGLEDGWAAVDIGAAGAMSEQAQGKLWVCWHCMLLVPLTGDAGVPAVLPLLLLDVLQGSGQCPGGFEAAAAEAHVLA
jgi:hypothetical protein